MQGLSNHERDGSQNQIPATSSEEPIYSKDKPLFKIDQRVHSFGDPHRIGTVKYVGPVEGHSGTWVGVDWDNGEGKHDGSVNGVRYFQAKGEKSGSLLRPHVLSKGISFLEALALRYRGVTTKEEEDEMYVLSASKKRVAIQLVGQSKVQEKLSRFEDLLRASLSYLGVSSMGPLHTINSAVPNIKELDLTGNLLSDWQDVGAICEELPALEVLILTNNIMMHNINPPPLLKNIRVLVLNNCGITWQQVEILKHSLSLIEELHLMANRLSEITTAPSVSMSAYVQGFDSLKILNLDDNCIDTWDEILKLSQLRSLEQLYLNKNNINRIYYSDFCPSHDLPSGCSLQENLIKPFKKLHCLLLGSNKIEDTESLDALNLFPSLMDVRLSENPIADPRTGGIPRFVLIARLAKIQILNGSEVCVRERKDSEIRYVRLVMAKMRLDNQEIKKPHPRFSELKERHGIEDEKSSTGMAGPQKMASGLLSITLKCVSPHIGEKPPLTKKMPGTITVGKLKGLCENFFKLKGIRPRLFLQEEGSPLPSLLDDDMASLIDLGIGIDGGTILVDGDN